MRIGVALLDSEDLARMTDGELLDSLLYLRSVGEVETRLYLDLYEELKRRKRAREMMMS